MRKLWPRVVQWLLVLALPVCLFVLNLRIVTGHWFVRWEYGKAGFPLDVYGFSTSERTYLAEVCVDYLATNADISLLADLQLPGGGAAFNERELSHMADVQFVYSRMMVAGMVVGAMLIGGIGALLGLGYPRRALVALLGGCLLLLGLLGVVGAFMLLNWSNFFTMFHSIFFEGGSWLFDYSDTLIRLFPVRFWMDIATVIVGLLLVEAFVIGGAAWFQGRRTRSNR